MIDWLGWLKRLEFTAVAALAIAGLCLLIGQSAERYRRCDHGLRRSPGGARVGNRGAIRGERFNAIDYATTGSIKGGTVVLASPCKVGD